MHIVPYIENLTVRLKQAGLSFGHGTDNPVDDAWYLVLVSLGLGIDVDEGLLARELTTSELAMLEDRVHRRIEDSVPTAYLVGEAWFAGFAFIIDERALIPRSPIAELIGNEFEPLLTSTPEHVLDLCTGSGCIGIACALHLPVKVDLADLSREALQLAQENVSRYELEDRVRLIESDLFDKITRKYDLILCNPPYVSADEIAQLPREFQHEPVMGLFSDEDGLGIPIRILQRAADFLTDAGLLILEVGYSHPLLSERFPQVPFLWLEFERGGEGVFALTRQQLLKYQTVFCEPRSTYSDTP